MADWNKYEAVIFDRQKEYEFNVIIWGVTVDTAREKLLHEYPVSKFGIVKLEPFAC